MSPPLGVRRLARRELSDLASAFLAIPLANIDRWLAKGNSAPHRLEQWRAIVPEAKRSADGMAQLLGLLRDDSEEAMRLKSYAPFPGVLNREKRDQLACGYSH